MLEVLRRGAKSWIAKALFAVLILSFGVWGIGDIFRSPGREVTVATVGDIDITRGELNDAFRRQINQLQPLFGGTLDSEQARRMGILDQTLQNMISGALYDLAARDLNIAVGDELVRRRVFEEPAFRGPAGDFDPQVFRRVLAQSGLSEERYVAALRQDLARLQLVNSVRAGVEIPDTLARALYRYREEQRVAETVFVSNDSITEVGEPEEAELRAYYDKHKERFRTPEFRRLTVATLTPESLMEEIAVSEEQLREAYDRRIDEFTKPEKRNVKQIVTPDEETAKRAYDALREGRGFESVAEEIADQAADTIDLGTITHDDLPQELADAAFSIDAGSFTEPVQSPLGWHILKVTEIMPGQVKSFAEARDELAETLKRELAQDGLYSLANQLDDELAAGTPLEEAARKLALDVRKVEAVDSQGRNREGEKIEGLPGGEFLELAFSTPEGTDSLLTEMPGGGYFVFRVDGIMPPQVPPLADVQEDVVATWQAAERERAAAERAKAIAERAAVSGDLAAAAKEFGLEPQTTGPFTRRTGASEAELPPALVDELFAASVGQTATASGSGGHYIAKVVDVRPADPGTDPEGLQDLKDRLRESVATDLLDQFTNALRRRYAVEVSRDVLDTTF